ncbi:MAG: hypothetical protein EOP14_07275, partial [Pseudomonas sp.]
MFWRDVSYSRFAIVLYRGISRVAPVAPGIGRLRAAAGRTELGQGPSAIATPPPPGAWSRRISAAPVLLTGKPSPSGAQPSGSGRAAGPPRT